MDGLPRPATATELYLAAIHEELCVIRSRLDPPDLTVDGEVELREPSAATCPDCGRTFKSASGLGRHRQARHQ